jgi:hypothetical protein
MKSNFVEEQYRQVERSIRICLKRKEKKGENFKVKPEIMSNLLALSYFSTLFRALLSGNIKDFKAGESEIDGMVDFLFNEFKS